MCSKAALFLWVFTIIAFVIRTDSFQLNLDYLRTNTNDEIQKNAVLNLIQRTIPERAKEFEVDIDPELESGGKDVFILRSESNVIKIIGNTGVAAATGFNYYLKYHCFCQISWQTSQLNLPEQLPEVNIKILLNDKVRYYQNVCTTSYSFVWWSWNQWEKHIDWMALNSFNLVLAFNGQEAIWKRVYQKFNLTDDEINEHFSGPAFLSWQRMGNIRGWGGPLSENWHSRSLILQKQIVERMREFGIIPVLPAFAGHLPRGFKRLYPNANMAMLDTWNNFSDQYCCPYFLDPTDNLFKQIGKAFIEEQIAEYGTDHVYNCDSFNENIPPSTDLQYISNVSRSIYESITEADKQGIWLMQGWLFVHDFFFWTNDRAKALLTAVPLGKMIVLDLQSEQFPQYGRLPQYFGQPYIWCMLHNFGGTLGNFGSISILNQRPIEARNFVGSTMIGIGLTPEGINQNYVVYDFMVENAWRNQTVNVTEWTRNYIQRRYGFVNDKIETSWQHFMATIYDFNGVERIRGQYALTRTPSWKISTWTWYDRTEYEDDFTNFVLGMKESETFENCSGCLYDLTDFSRQVLQLEIDLEYENMLTCFNNKNLSCFETAARNFQTTIGQIDIILSANPNFLLGSWISDAKKCASTPDEEKQYEYNARNQITLWGPNGEIMNYANKQWGGVVADFFGPRWQLFIEYSSQILKNNGKFNQNYIKNQMFKKVEEPFTFSNKVYPTESIKENPMEYALALASTISKKKDRRFERSPKISPAEDDSIDYLHLYGKRAAAPVVILL